MGDARFVRVFYWVEISKIPQPSGDTDKWPNVATGNFWLLDFWQFLVIWHLFVLLVWFLVA